MDRSARFEADASSRFEQLSREREARRRAYEASPHPLPLVGRCLEMCPEYERYEREVHLDLSAYEMQPGTERPQTVGEHPRIDHGRAVKKYHRPAAGNEAPLPEDVRPPAVLRRTMAYLVGLASGIWQEQGMAGFVQVQKFVRDRTRSLRQDATLQNLRVDADSLAVHEETARFHILCGHRLCEFPTADFDAFQNTEQLRKVLQSLAEFYRDCRAAGRAALCGSEAEFRSYYLLTHLEDPDVFRKCFSWPPEVLHAAPVQFALVAGAAFHQTDYIKFFSLVTGGPPGTDGRIGYLMRCLLHGHFGAMRVRSAGVLTKAYAQNAAFPAARLAAWLAFEDEPELVAFCEAAGFGLVRDPATQRVVSAARPTALGDAGAVRVRRSDRRIESRVHGVSISELILTGRAEGLPLVVAPAVASAVAPAPPAVAILAAAPAEPSFVARPVEAAPPRPVAVAAPAAALRPKPAPVPAAVPADTAAVIARLMLADLVASACHGQVQDLAAQAWRRGMQCERLAKDTLRALLAERVDALAAEAVERQRSLYRERVCAMSQHLLQGLLQSVVDEVVQGCTVGAIKEAYRDGGGDAAAAEYDYSVGIQMEPVREPAAVRRRVCMREVPANAGPRLDAGELKAALEAERTASARFETQLRALLARPRHQSKGNVKR